jgi:uncharacterized protein involved in type VI secretion and phage assembly
MSFAGSILQDRERNERDAPVHGLVLAYVQKIADDGYYLNFRSTHLGKPQGPARIATLMAGKSRGSFFMPEVGDEVVVGFELGDLNRPIILGSLWNDKALPPSQADTSSSNNVRTLVSRVGHEITFDDSPAGQKIVIKSKGGLTITIQDQPTPKIQIKSNDGGVAGSKIELDGVAWNHQHATGVGPSGPPVSITPVP